MHSYRNLTSLIWGFMQIRIILENKSKLLTFLLEHSRFFNTTWNYPVCNGREATLEMGAHAQSNGKVMSLEKSIEVHILFFSQYPNNFILTPGLKSVKSWPEKSALFRNSWKQCIIITCSVLTSEVEDL